MKRKHTKKAIKSHRQKKSHSHNDASYEYAVLKTKLFQLGR